MSKNKNEISKTINKCEMIDPISTTHMKITLNDTKFNNLSQQISSTMTSNNNYFNNLDSELLQTISSRNASLIKAANLPIFEQVAKSIKKISLNFGNTIVDTINSPAIKWLQILDFTALQNTFKNFSISLSEYRKFNKIYLQAMFECHWFPYVGSTIDINLMKDVFNVLATSRGVSKRRENRIDKTILSYYVPKEIKNIKRNWNKSDLKPHIKRILGQAIEAHLRGEYVLTITCLSSMWESLIYYKAGINKPLYQKRTKEEFKKLTIENGYSNIFSEFYDNFILGPINTPEEVIEGIPNRNGCTHGKYKKYPNEKSSLNAILITDFIINLEPNEENEMVKTV